MQNNHKASLTSFSDLKLLFRIPERNKLLYFIFIVGGLLLIMSSRTLKRIATEPIWLFMGLQILLMLCYRGFWRLLFTRYFILINGTVLLFTIYFVTGHDSDLMIQLPYYIKNIPFFVLGFYIVQDSFRRDKILFFYLASYAMVALVDIKTMYSISMGGLYKSEIALALKYGGMSYMASKNDLILWFPCLSLLVLLSFTLWTRISSKLRMVVAFFQLILIYQIAISGWVAAILLLAFGLCFIVILKVLSNPKRLRLNIKIAMVVVIMGGFGLFVLSEQIEGQSGSALRRLLKVTNSAITCDWQQFSNALEDVSGRVKLSIWSYEEFKKSPLIGTGGLFQGGEHSHFFDTLGRYGILGSFFLTGQLVYWFWLAWANYRRFPDDNLSIVFLSVLTTFLVGNIMNPYFPKTYLDNLVFLVGGFSCGQHYFSKYGKVKKNIIAIYGIN